jgi:hypothetical protein
MSVARFIADQRTFYRVPHAVCCVILGVSVSWLYKWLDRPATARQRRRGELDAEVLKMFKASKRTYGSPRIHADLLEAGWTVSVNTVADSMRRQGLQGRKPKHSKGLTRQDRKAPKFPDLLKRDFTAPAPNVKWCGDMTEIPTDEGKLYLLVTWNQRAGWIITDRHHDHELRGPVTRERRGEVAGPGSARTSRRVAHDLDQSGPCAPHHRRLRARAGGVPAGL